MVAAAYTASVRVIAGAGTDRDGAREGVDAGGSYDGGGLFLESKKTENAKEKRSFVVRVVLVVVVVVVVVLVLVVLIPPVPRT